MVQSLYWDCTQAGTKYYMKNCVVMNNQSPLCALLRLLSFVCAPNSALEQEDMMMNF